jgi:hypothetical protein
MITEKMVSDTGGNMSTLKPELIEALDRMFHHSLDIKCELHFPPSGFNSGKHDGPWHPRGAAVDFYLTGNQPPIFEIIALMILSGFTGIGVYWNGKIISFHGDIRPDFAQWVAVKRDGSWKYSALINDPRLL